MPARQLILMRHASAATSSDDHERALTERGREESRAAGLCLAQAGLEQVLCSTARRAVETWVDACEQLAPAPRLELDRRLYLAGADAILERVMETPQSMQRVLVIGHNPGMHELAWQLARGSSLEETLARGMRPATLVWFDVEVDEWLELRPAAVTGRSLWHPPARP